MTDLFIKRPVATTLLMAALVFFGVVSYFSLPISEMPNIDFPTIQVTASLPGADPQTMRLPVIDGREVIDRVRGAQTRYADIPIVVVTGFGLEQHLDFFNRYRISHYLAKPYDCDELATIVRAFDSH